MQWRDDVQLQRRRDESQLQVRHQLICEGYLSRESLAKPPESAASPATRESDDCVITMWLLFSFSPIQKEEFMEAAMEEMRMRLKEIEELEPRAVPGILTITPLGITDGTSNTIVSSSPKFGLTIAHDRTGGVITWIVV